ncbi:hypothetical protein KI387_003930, partial [Taxus chinensis]
GPLWHADSGFTGSTTMVRSSKLSHSDGSEGCPIGKGYRIGISVDNGIGICSYFDREAIYIIG